MRPRTASRTRSPPSHFPSREIDDEMIAIGVRLANWRSESRLHFLSDLHVMGDRLHSPHADLKSKRPFNVC